MLSAKRCQKKYEDACLLAARQARRTKEAARHSTHESGRRDTTYRQLANGQHSGAQKRREPTRSSRASSKGARKYPYVVEANGNNTCGARGVMRALAVTHLRPRYFHGLPKRTAVVGRHGCHAPQLIQERRACVSQPPLWACH